MGKWSAGRSEAKSRLGRALLVAFAVLVFVGPTGSFATVATPVASAATPVAEERFDPAAAEQRLFGVLVHHILTTPSMHAVLGSLRAPALGLDWTRAEGTFDRATGQVLLPDNTFRIASNTKTFTAAAALRLVEDGKIGLDQPIAALLPPQYVALLARSGYDPSAILVRHLLAHTSGLFDYGTSPAYEAAVFAEPTKRWTRLEQVQFAMDNGHPVGPPGTVFHYSDTGYVLLGEIIERSSGLSLAAAYRELLGFERLGLRATYLESLEPTPPTAPARAHQYFGDVDATDLDPSFDLFGGGGLVSNVGDLARFYQALLQGAVFRDPATLETMLTIPSVNAEAGAAMGLFRFDVLGRECWGHGGFWGSVAFSCPADGLTLALSINQAMPGDGFDEDRLIGDLLAAAQVEGR